jgi:hypothetical protein
MLRYTTLPVLLSSGKPEGPSATEDMPVDDDVHRFPAATASSRGVLL